MDFSNDAKEGDASVVVTIASFTLVLILGYDSGVSHVFGHRSLSPALAENFTQGVQ